MSDKEIAELAQAAIDRYDEMGNCTRPGIMLQKARKAFNESMTELREAIYPPVDTAA